MAAEKREPCDHHDEIVKCIQHLTTDMATDKVRQENSDKIIVELAGDAKEIKKALQDFTLKATESYATWNAHDKLRQEMREMNEELRRYVIRIFSLGITIAGGIFGLVQWVLTTTYGG